MFSLQVSWGRGGRGGGVRGVRRGIYCLTTSHLRMAGQRETLCYYQDRPVISGSAETLCAFGKEHFPLILIAFRRRVSYQ